MKNLLVALAALSLIQGTMFGGDCDRDDGAENPVIHLVIDRNANVLSKEFYHGSVKKEDKFEVDQEKLMEAILDDYPLLAKLSEETSSNKQPNQNNDVVNRENSLYYLFEDYPVLARQFANHDSNIQPQREDNVSKKANSFINDLDIILDDYPMLRGNK